MTDLKRACDEEEEDAARLTHRKCQVESWSLFICAMEKKISFFLSTTAKGSRKEKDTREDDIDEKREGRERRTTVHVVIYSRFADRVILLSGDLIMTAAECRDEAARRENVPDTSKEGRRW